MTTSSKDSVILPRSSSVLSTTSSVWRLDGSHLMRSKAPTQASTSVSQRSSQLQPLLTQPSQLSSRKLSSSTEASARSPFTSEKALLSLICSLCSSLTPSWPPSWLSSTPCGSWSSSQDARRKRRVKSPNWLKAKPMCKLKSSLKLFHLFLFFSLFSGVNVDMAIKYGALMKTMLLTSFYAPVSPVSTVIGIAGMIMVYWADKVFFSLTILN